MRPPHTPEYLAAFQEMSDRINAEVQQEMEQLRIRYPQPLILVKLTINPDAESYPDDDPFEVVKRRLGYRIKAHYRI